MLFNSYVFILLFLPVVFCGYHLLIHFRWNETGKIFLILASLYFYSYFKWDYLPLLVISILLNYAICRGIQQVRSSGGRKALTALGCILNLGILGYFKYTGFLFENLNTLLHTSLNIPAILLPLGISFYTFQQLSFLIDCYRGDRTNYTLTDYALFVTFFPQLIAGPIVLPGEMLPQFNADSRRNLNWENMNTGLFLFACGLAKKCFVADSLAIIVNLGFKAVTPLTLAESWLVSLAFTFQLYYDFSGYCDMAIGLGKFFNIDLPMNFNSPYKATDFQDFWRRWHMTLGRFMMNYLYIPLGGNRKGMTRTLINLLIVFLVSGLWHGVGWLFLIWGGLHGAGILIHRLWKQFSDQHLNHWRMPRLPAICLTFFFVNLLWVFFRAKSLTQAFGILKSMFFGAKIGGLSSAFRHMLNRFDFSKEQLIFIFFVFASVAFLLPNSAWFADYMKQHRRLRIMLTVLFFLAGFFCISRMSPFLYFNF